MRRLGIAGLVLLALLGGLLFWRVRPDGAVRAAAPSEGAAAPVPPVAPPADDDGPDAAADDPEEGEEVATIDIRGTVVVVDENGRHLTGESGSFRTDRWGDFEVVRGEWRATVPLGWPLRVEEVLLGGRKAIPNPATIEIPPDGVVEVRCLWCAPARLRVVGEKGEDLEGVELCARESEDLVRDERNLIAAGPSPVTIPGEDAGVLKYWVRARGHAWSRIAVWQGYGGERVVRLARAGTLEVGLVPLGPEGLISILLYRSGEQVLDWRPDDSGFARIEGLPPGRVEVRATTWGGRRNVLAAAEVEIEPGKTTEISLSLRDASLEPVPVEVTLHVDPRWEERAEVRITADGGYFSDVEEGEDGRWRTELLPGRHFFTVEPWTYSQAVEVGPRGTTAARLVVPPPCDVEVHLVDKATGDPIPDEDDLYWHVKSGRIDSTYVDDTSERFAEPGVWRFRAPLGTLVLWLWNDLHDAGYEEFELKPGKNLVELKAVQNYACDLALMDGAIPVPVDEEMSAAIRAAALDGGGEIDSARADFPCRVWFTKPGRYRISIPVEGYAPIDPIEVEIAAGRIPKVEVPLRRR